MAPTWVAAFPRSSVVSSLFSFFKFVCPCLHVAFHRHCVDIFISYGYTYDRAVRTLFTRGISCSHCGQQIMPAKLSPYRRSRWDAPGEAGALVEAPAGGALNQLFLRWRWGCKVVGNKTEELAAWRWTGSREQLPVTETWLTSNIPSTWSDRLHCRESGQRPEAKWQTERGGACTLCQRQVVQPRACDCERDHLLPRHRSVSR